MKPRHLRSPRRLAMELAALLMVAGCSKLPTEPLDAIRPDSGTGAQTEALGSGFLGGTSSTTTKTVVVGILGGTVSVGDFTVVIPPAALTRTATVTVSQPDPTHPVVNLSISPSSANRFLVPVVLTANVKRMDPALLSVAGISYYNPATGKWELVPGSSVNFLSLTVSAPLWHFSTYCASAGGKAGW